jgi:hypothetical protein
MISIFSLKMIILSVSLATQIDIKHEMLLPIYVVDMRVTRDVCEDCSVNE